VPPPKGQPYGVALPGTQTAERSAVYRHWRFADKPLLDTLDPAIKTPHDAFEMAGTWDEHDDSRRFANRVLQRRDTRRTGASATARTTPSPRPSAHTCGRTMRRSTAGGRTLAPGWCTCIDRRG
jgi:hypothetical protein